VNCCVVPFASDIDDGEIEIDFSVGAVTVIMVDPVTVPRAAVIVADPGAREVASPAEETVAMLAAPVDQVTELVRLLVVPSL